MNNLLHYCDHSNMGKDARPGCIVVYNEDECPLCMAEKIIREYDKDRKEKTDE